MSRQRKQSQSSYLGGKCVISGTDIGRWGGATRHLTFHHVNAERKAENYENLIRRNCSLSVLAELDKCQLLRSDIHQVVEDQKIGGFITLADGRNVPFHSGLIDPAMEFGAFATLFLDEPDLKRIVPRSFLVRNGKKETIMDENEFCNTFLESVTALEVGDTFEVSVHGIPVLTVKKLEPKLISLKVDSRFDVLSWEVRTKDNVFCVSRGRMLDKNWRMLADRPFTLTYPRIRMP